MVPSVILAPRNSGPVTPMLPRLRGAVEDDPENDAVALMSMVELILVGQLRMEKDGYTGTAKH